MKKIPKNKHFSKEYYQKIIDEAFSINEFSDFICGCQEFLNKAGFLTEKQVDALLHIEPPQKDFSDIDEYWDY